MDSSLPRPAPPRSLIERLREWIVWFGAGRLTATALAVIGVAIGGTWLLKGSPSRAEDQLPFATHSTVPTAASAGISAEETTTTAAPSVVVYVAGAIAVPGVYTLPPLARVTDAISAAGGALATADLNVVNLAAAVHDGERIYVPIVGEVVPAVLAGDPVADATVPAGPVNVNTATADQLDVLPGVGPTTAAAIVAHREQHGPFQTIDQLGDVHGIGPAKLEALRGLVTV
ncbi:MAG: ComEA family DNA-binding protein [Ilumatobacteraceae bacterium]|nr:ComEA family DNA-binding protein [Ilumatobacteraceae bacterium]